LLAGTDPELRMKELYEARKALYAECADLSIDTESKSIPEIVEAILDALR
jgi:shikimate kinase